jgi:uncharacterized protein YjbI with pentapeptide repeats
VTSWRDACDDDTAALLAAPPRPFSDGLDDTYCDPGEKHERRAAYLGAYLRSGRWEGRNLAGAGLAFVSVPGFAAGCADLRGAYLEGADLRGADLTEAHLEDAYLYGADLSGAWLTYAHLSGANLADATLCGAHLDGADLRGAELTGADLRGATLNGADLTGATVLRARFPDDLVNLAAADDRPGEALGGNP